MGSSRPAATPGLVSGPRFLDGAVRLHSVAVAALLHANAFVDDPRIDEAIERTVALAGPLLSATPERSPIWWRRCRCGPPATRSS